MVATAFVDPESRAILLEGGARLASLPPGNVVLPPLAQLYLPPGSYVVSANFSVTSNLAGGGTVFAMLGTSSQGSMSWTWRMPPHGSPGDGQAVHLQGVVTLAAVSGSAWTPMGRLRTTRSSHTTSGS